MSARPLKLIRICLMIVCAQFAFAVAAYGQVQITFQGHVKYSTGEPVVGATVTMTVRHNGSPVSTETTTTDGGGDYTFQSSRSNPPCTPNEWSFQAFIAEVVDDEALPPSQTASSSGCVGPGTITLGDLIIARPHQITLGGIVRDAFGMPAQGLTVTMTRTKYDLNPPVVTTANTTTDGDGHYQFTTWSRCSVVEEFKASINGVILQGGTSTSGCVLNTNDNLNFPTNLGLRKAENAGVTSCNANVGRPVNVMNGNVYLQQSDFQLPSSVGGIGITRTYNSISQDIGLFGRGWTTDFDERVATDANNQLELTLPDGKLVTFATPDFFGQIIKNGNGTYTVTFKDGRVHQFDVAGKLVSMTDLNGNQTVLAYDGTGRLTTVTDPFGRVLTVTTNSSGRVLSISDSMGTIATYTYTSDRLLSVTYADNSAFQFSYTSIPGGFGLTSVTDALGNIIEQHDYDAQGRATSSQAHGGVESYTLNYVSLTETDVTDTLNRVTKFFFRRIQGRYVVDRVEGLCSCGGSQVQTWNYDDQANVTSKADALNHLTSYTYDANGNRLTETDATGTISYTYNSLGQVLTRTDQLNGVTTNTYDAQANLLTTNDALNNTTTLTYDARGQMLTITDARGKVTSFTYDTIGNLTRRTDANSIITFFFYDARRRMTKVRDGLSRSTLLAYDAAGRVNKVTHPDLSFISFTYDLAGRRTVVTDERGNPTNYAYDSAYRLTSVTDAANQTTSYGYDAMSHQTSITDSLSRVTDYEYDDFERLKKITYPSAEVGATRLFETIGYDADGNVTSRTDTAGRVTSYVYDGVNRLTSTTDAANKTTAFGYDALSRVTSLTDAITQQYQFVYDALGRQTQITRAGVSMSYAYDEVGNRTQRTDYNGVVTNYSYDNLNRVTTITYPSRTVTYAYDPLNNVTRATNENDSVYISYDNRYRVSSFSDPFFYGVSYNYDTVGNRTKLKVNGATYATYTYDSVNRLTNLADSASLNFTYNYDAANRPTSRTAPNGVTSSSAYDGLDRLTSLMHTAGGTTLSGNLYTYNNANNISSWTTASEQKGFTYDAVDRLTNVTNYEAPAENYSYDGVGNRIASHLSASYGYQPFNKLTSTAVTSYSYDNNGNLISKSDASGTTTYTFNEENQLTQVSLPNSLTVNYKYDGLGRRIQRTTSAGANERYVYDGADALIDLNADWSVATTYFNDLGIDSHLRQTSAATGVSYFLADHLGSTDALTDLSGNVIEQLAYDSFGNSTGSVRTRYGYTGRERDPDTGQLYYRARFYDPQVGRFISEDPAGLIAGINLYAYVENDPIRSRDPFGLCKCGVKVGPEYYVAGSWGSGSVSIAGKTISQGTRFYWHAEFLNGGEYDPKCCEVRQLVSWNRGPFGPNTVPHNGFPNWGRPGTWFEDRNEEGWSAGHRATDSRYVGNEYTSWDQPEAVPGSTVPGFALRFRLIVVDVCRGGRRVYTSKTITVNF
jgi:RHS repeat-associated protein